jgi:hypothetical protein
MAGVVVGYAWSCASAILGAWFAQAFGSTGHGPIGIWVGSPPRVCRSGSVRRFGLLWDWLEMTSVVG